MGKLIYVDDIVKRLERVIRIGAKADDGEHPISAECVLSVLESLPTVEAVEVVRCKDCIHYQFASNRAFGFPVKQCKWTGFEDIDDYDFCSSGRRKDGDNHG